MASALKLGLGLGLGLLLAACASRGLAPRSTEGSGLPPLAGVPAFQPSPTPAPAFPQTKPVDESRPVKVKARSLRYDQSRQETVFYGGVTATQDSTVLTSRELRSSDQGQNARADGDVKVVDPTRHFQAEAQSAVYANAMRSAELAGGVRLVSVDPYGVPVTVTGQSGRYVDLSRVASVEGGVHVQRGAMSADAGRAELERGGELLRLLDQVSVHFGANRGQADTAAFDQATRDMTMQGSVRARFIPREVRKAGEAPWNAAPTSQEAK